MSIDASQVSSRSSIGQGYNKRSKLVLPNLKGASNPNNLPSYGKRFKSVKARDYNNRTNIAQEPVKLETLLPTSFRNISEALPIALLKKMKTLEKSDEGMFSDLLITINLF